MDKQSAELNELLKKFFPDIKGDLEELERENWSQESVLSTVSSMLSNGPIQELFRFKSRLFPIYVENTDPQLFGKITAHLVAEEIETFYILNSLMGLLKQIDSGVLSTQNQLKSELLTTMRELMTNRKMAGFEEIGVVVFCSTEEELKAVTTQIQVSKLWKNSLNYFGKENYAKVKAILNLEKQVSGKSSVECLVTNDMDAFLAECKDKPVVIIPKLRNDDYPGYEQLIEKLLENGSRTTAPTWLTTSPDDAFLERRIAAVKQLSKRKGWKTELILHTGGMGFFPDTKLKEIKSILKANLQRQGIIELAQSIADVTGGTIVVVEKTAQPASKTIFDRYPLGTFN